MRAAQEAEARANSAAGELKAKADWTAGELARAMDELAGANSKLEMAGKSQAEL